MNYFDFYSIPALIIVVTIHEFAHAWTANYLGDPTAKIAGRVSLNPLQHLDLVGSIMFIFFGIGWGKPVPYNPYNLKNPVRDGALVSLAGPLSNFLTAIVLALPYKLLQTSNIEYLVPFARIIEMIFSFSLILMVFNLLPIPPLDGSKALMLILPKRFQHKYERYLEGGMGYFVAAILIDQLVLFRLFGVSILSYIVGSLYELFKYVILLGT